MHEQDTTIAPEVEYRDVPGFPGYRVGDDGTVWSCWVVSCKPYMGSKWKVLNPGVNGKYGHKFVNLRREKKSHKRYLHRLVLEVFVGPCPEGMEGCHAPDRNPANNRLENLRWGTSLDNAEDMMNDGTSTKGMRNGHAVLTDEYVMEARGLYATGNWTQAKLAERYGVTRTTIAPCLRGETWKHLPHPQHGTATSIYATIDA